MVDQFGSDNNCGFNLTNFKPHLIKDFFPDVVKDYERSFIGAFATSLLSQVDFENHDLYFTLCKFINNHGFSLTQNSVDEYPQPLPEDCVVERDFK